jgi:hypothetical protein
VAQAGDEWCGLSQGERDFFLSSSNSFGDFIISLARKTMIVREIGRLDYLERGPIVSLGDSWARRRAFQSSRLFIENEVAASLGEDDIRFFRDHMGTTVWYTLDPGGAGEETGGPIQISMLRRDLAVHLDSMTVRLVLPLSDGTPVRLDSLYVTDPELTEASLQDTARIRELALSRYTSVWSDDRTEAVIDSILAEARPAVDGDVLDSLCSWYSDSTGQPATADTVVVSGLGTWTVQDIIAEVETTALGAPVAPEDREWMDWLVGRMLEVEAMIEYLSVAAPDSMVLIAAERHAWMMQTAAESLYEDAVSSAVEVTVDQTMEVYGGLSELPVVPEKRSIECVEIRLDMVDEYRRALENGTVEELLDELVVMVEFSSEDPPTRFTRPLEQDEVPGGHGEAVFSLEPGDTGWSEPLDLVEGFSSFAFRLVEVHPRHEATFEEMSEELESVVRTRLEEERTNSWLLELEERYGLRINEGILDDLPPDPAMWKDL